METKVPTPPLAPVASSIPAKATPTHPQSKPKTKKDHLCHECGKNFASSNTLLTHYKGAHLEAFKCNQCGKILCTKVQLDSHINSHQDIKPHKCDKCGKSFQNRKSLSSHSCTDPAKRSKCNKCSRTFGTRALMNQHQRSHDIVLMYSCSFCYSQFKYRQGLDQHMKKSCKSAPK